MFDLWCKYWHAFTNVLNKYFDKKLVYLFSNFPSSFSMRWQNTHYIYNINAKHLNFTLYTIDN